MKRIVIFFVCVFFATSATEASSGKCEIIFLYNPQQGIGHSVELISDSQSPKKIFPRGTERITVISNAKYTFEAKIGGSSKFLRMDVMDERINVRIGAKITPSGVKVDTFYVYTREALPAQAIQPRIDSLSKHPVRLIDSSINYVKSGRDQFGKGNYDQAIKEFNRAIPLNPNNADAYSSLGRVYILLRYYDQAIANYRIALQINPNDLKIEQDLERALESQEKEQVIEKKNICFEDSLRVVAALIHETEAITELAKVRDSLRDAIVKVDTMTMRQTMMKTRVRYLSCGSIALGFGAILYGIIENGNVTSLIDKSQFRQAEKTAKARDTAYCFGMAVLLSGISIRIIF